MHALLMPVHPHARHPQPAKYTARLRTLKTDANPLLLKVNMAAGHGGASGRYDLLREFAFAYAFLLQQFCLAG